MKSSSSSEFNQDWVVYGVLGISFLALLILKGPDLMQGISEQGRISESIRRQAKDSEIAMARYSVGCSTQWQMSDGSQILSEGFPAIDIESGQVLPPGSVLCGPNGATAIVSSTGFVSDIRVSAQLQRIYLERGFSNANDQLFQKQQR
jgi:hypothetical protein